MILFRPTIALFVMSVFSLNARGETMGKPDTLHSGQTGNAVMTVEADRGAGGIGKQTQKAALLPQTTCPVMGGAIDKKLYVDYKGKRLYMCCLGCKAELSKNPEKYLRKLEAAGQAAEVITVKEAVSKRVK